MNGRTLHKAPDLSQVEIVYTDETPVGTDSGITITPAVGAYLAVKPEGFAMPPATANFGSNIYAGPGRRILIYPVQSTFTSRRSSVGVSQVSLTNGDRYRFVAIKGRKSLQTITVTQQKFLRSFDITNSPNLTQASINSCDNIETLSFAGCRKIASIIVNGMNTLSDLLIPSDCRQSITNLSINNAPLLVNLSFSGMSNLANFSMTQSGIRIVDLSETIVGSPHIASDSAEYFKSPATMQSVTFQSTGLTTADVSASIECNYFSFGGCSSLSSFTMPPNYEGYNGKANINLNGCGLSASALVSFLNGLGTFAGSKSYIDISSNPGSSDSAVQNAASDAANNRYWNVYTGII